ncbi:MAG TPA: glycosyltransferase family 4 protein [Candidatus Limnocylindrales bacterium]|nr:glycosyltransferase family 4 protein [Candidatus Limnocylindrales bacterium]
MVGPGLTAGGRRRAPRPVLMIVHAYYEEDPRVRRQAEAIVATGRPVTVIGLRREGDPTDTVLGGVRVRNLDVQRHQGAGLGTYLGEYLEFFARATWAAVKAHRRQRVAVVQAHSLPDFLVFAGLPLRLVGVPLLLDLHEAMPEFFRTRFPGANRPLLHRLVLLQERLSVAVSTKTITTTEAMGDRLVALGVPRDKIQIVINSPSLARFDRGAYPRRGFREDGRLRLIYTGALTPTYELDVALRALAALVTTRPELDPVLDLYGRGDSEAALRALAAELGVADRVTFHGRIPIDDVPAAVANADIGIAPTRLDPFTALTISGKVHEYAAMGKPVVASALPTVVRMFPDGAVATYPPGDATALTAAIVRFVDEPLERERAVARATAVVEDAAWERASRGYLALIERLAGDRPVGDRAQP